MLAMMLAALLIGLAGPPPQSSPLNSTLVRVFVHTGDGGHPEELAARRESVKDLADALADKEKTIAVVAADDLADLDIEILGRGLIVPRVVFGIGARPGQPPGGNAPMRAAVLRVKLTWTGDPFELRNRNTVADTRQGWERAAGDLAKQIEKWIGERRAAILKARRTQ
jgi:hypothetical protein